MDQSNEGPFDLLLVLDATYSMGTFVDALNKSLQEVVSIAALTGSFERIGVLAYRDYCSGELTEWSGWCSPSGKVRGPEIVSQDVVLSMARNIVPTGGGDWPEATKTGLARAYSEMRSEAKTVVLLYTDAPPHFQATGGQNYPREKKALNNKSSYGGSGHLFVDWTSAAKTLASGPKTATVFSVIQKTVIGTYSSYLYLSTITGGQLFEIEEMTADIISQLTVGLLLTWMRLGKTVTNTKAGLGNMKRYKSTTDINDAKREDDSVFGRYVAKGEKRADKGIESEPVTLGVLPSLVKARGPRATSFGKKYTEDEDYRSLAVEQLRRIIQTNVSAVSVNPIFGSLWRTICNDRGNEARDELIQLFGLHVDRISDKDDKFRMKAWLAESYNYADEINHMIKSVPVEDRFPLVFLDPTADFKTPADQDGGDDAENNRPLNGFSRAELLEIGRSCDYKILRRLGKVLTRLTYVEKREDMPEHIKNTSATRVPRIPMSLASERHNRKFWKVLLHAVLPGTLITTRPAALLAALSLRMGIAPLRDVAEQELISFCDKWNTIDVPETWNLGCLNLLLDADEDYEKRVSKGLTARKTPTSRILLEQDRDMFRTLVDYKMLELNMATTLTANITWQPDKTQVAMGPLVLCHQCEFPRSVTIMSGRGICGFCYTSKTCKCLTCTRSDNYEECCAKNVSKDDNEGSLGYWVECAQVLCRAQYVVYNPNALNVRPKCFYCRHKDEVGIGKAPFVECSKCLGRIIWPEEYRPRELDVTSYRCSACVGGVTTVVAEDTSALALSKENGKDWLLRNEGNSINEPFNGRTLFYTATHCDLPNLATKVEVLPQFDPRLTIRGKPLQNEIKVKDSLRSWVLSRRTETGCCSLCFSDVRKSDLQPACGRSGCHQLICNGCKRDWYGINAPGRIINIAALSCPFCRRLPAPKTVSTFRIAHIGDLKTAVAESGSWIFSWCGRCGFAKHYIERVCAAGPPPELNNWRCDPCTPKALESRSVLCPGCGVATEKMGGCDHITCPCGAHWCYGCGKQFSYDSIYSHLSSEHGGLYEGYAEDMSDDDWD